jgi:histidine triad (HIT) family protein
LTKIIAGDIPCYKVYEDKHFFAFLDINPLAKGHTLVVPKIENDYVFDLPDEAYLELMRISKLIALAIGKAVPCKRIGVAVVGLEVPHTHIHLIPLHQDAINFSNPKLKLESDEMEQIVATIQAAF